MGEEKITEKQIENWRSVLVGMIGPYALIMPKEDIQKFRDITQNKINDKHSTERREYERPF